MCGARHVRPKRLGRRRVRWRVGAKPVKRQPQAAFRVDRAFANEIAGGFHDVLRLGRQIPDYVNRCEHRKLRPEAPFFRAIARGANEMPGPPDRADSRGRNRGSARGGATGAGQARAAG